MGFDDLEDELLDDMNGTAGSMAEMLEGVEGQLYNMMRSTQAIPETVREHLEAFAAAINWQEKWIRGILALHVVTWTTFLVFRKWPRVQVVLFFVVAAIVGSAERWNTWGANNWRRFATQNYFDEHGVFATSVVCAPLLTLGFVMLFNFLGQAASLLVTVKRNELKQYAKKKRRDEATASQQDGTAPQSQQQKKDQ